MKNTERSEAEQSFDVPLRYGRTSGKYLKGMPENKLFAIGYNPKYGLVDVLEDTGKPFFEGEIFEGRVNIEGLLSKLQSESQEEVESQVEDYILESYDNWCNSRTNTANPQSPIFEVLTYKSNN